MDFPKSTTSKLKNELDLSNNNHYKTMFKIPKEKVSSLRNTEISYNLVNEKADTCSMLH